MAPGAGSASSLDLKFAQNLFSNHVQNILEDFFKKSDFPPSNDFMFERNN